eukprot:sb/3473371/
MKEKPTETSKQPIRTRYQPIRDQYYLIRSVPGMKLSVNVLTGVAIWKLMARLRLPVNLLTTLPTAIPVSRMSISSISYTMDSTTSDSVCAIWENARFNSSVYNHLQKQPIPITLHPYSLLCWTYLAMKNKVAFEPWHQSYILVRHCGALKND